MNLTHLSYILEIAKTGSITKAAQNLYMGQPNLSKAVRDMEKSMGTAIFKRTAKGVEPTEKGREFIEKARELLEETNNFEEHFFGKKEEQARLWIAVSGAEYYFSEFQRIVLTNKDREKINFGFLNCERETAIQLTAEGKTDYAVIRSGEDKDKFAARIRERGLTPKLISKSNVRIAVNERDMLAAKDKITPEDLQNYTEITILQAGVSERREKTVSFNSTEHAFKMLVQLKNSFMRVSSLDEYGSLKGIEVKDFIPESCFYDWIVSVGE